MTVGRRPLVAGAFLLAAADAYLLALVAAAALRRRPGHVPPPGTARFTILVPAHDEETTLPFLLASLERVEGRDRARVVVVADNCTDRTAEVARAGGADVLERRDPARPGKGPALAWALEQLAPLDTPVVMVDADCEVSANLLTALEAHLRDGAAAAQVDYVVANPEESPASALRAAAFSLVNTVRPAGRSALGLSAGLLGTGMMFAPDLLRRIPWRDFGLAEDLEYGLRLVAAGERVVFVPEARVTSAMPTGTDAARTQELRWEAGKIKAARAWTPRLLRAAVRRRDPRPLVAAVEVLIPPQTLLLLAHVGLAAIAAVARAPRALRLALAGTAAQALYVVGGLAVVRAPASVWRGLLAAPRALLAKPLLALRIAAGKGPAEWRRTPRADRARGTAYPDH